MTDIVELIQQAETDQVVDLFALVVLGSGLVLRWTPGPLDREPVWFGGDEYTPVPIEATGFEWAGTGPLPTPSLRVSNVGGLVGALIVSAGDLVGSQVTRLRTFKRYLDGEEEADPTATLQPDVFRLERKVHQSREYVQYDLSAWIDQEGRKLPGRQVLRDICTQRYRIWRDGAFDYSKATCPYAGEIYFDRLDQRVGGPSLDACSKSVRGCKARFGAASPLPTWAFPGAGRARAAG